MQIPETLSCKMRNMALLCAFLVVVIHCRPRFEAGSFAWWVKQFTEEGITRVVVPYFFAASGFVAAVKFDFGGYGSLVVKQVGAQLLTFAIWTTLSWSSGGGLEKYFLMPLVAFAVSLAIAAAMHRFMPRISAILFGGR